MFARDGYSTIAVVLGFSIGAGALSLYFLPGWIATSAVTALSILSVFILYFFRDPDRTLPDNPDVIVSPADGKVVSVKEVKEEVYLKGKAHQISIFLSPLDVHVNRVPATGIIEYVKYHPGVYLMAWDDRASNMNERADFGMIHPRGRKVFFRQITGFLARRIVYHIKEGDHVEAGTRFGMMKFGSRMDILVPSDLGINVTEGDRTVGGETVLATFNKPDNNE